MRLFSENADFTGNTKIPAHLRREHETRYEFALQYVLGKDVLDLGCGYGYGTNILSMKAKSVIGVDRMKEGIVLAGKRYENQKNISFVESDVFEFLSSTKDKFDIVILMEFIEHITNQDELLSLVYKVLKPGGRVCLSTPNKDNTPFFRRNPYHFKELSYQEFLSLIGKYFDIDLKKGQTNGFWNFFPYLIMTPITSKLGIYENIVKLNDKPEKSGVVLVSALKNIKTSQV